MPGYCTSLRMAVLEKQRINQSPGPAAYDSQVRDVVLPSSPKYSIPRAAPHNFVENTPGPGQYQSLEQLSTTGRNTWDSRMRNIASAPFGKAGRGDLSFSSISPGPAAYDPPPREIFNRTAPSYSFPSGQRGSKPSSDAPGPGAYSPPGTPATGRYRREVESTRPNSASHVFGRAPRSPNSHADRTPGPAAYRSEDVDALGHRTITSVRPNTASAKFGTSSRMQRLLNETPGPYNPAMNGLSTIRSTPKYSLPKASRGDEINKRATTPGPADYSFTDNAASVLPSAPSIRLGRDARFRSTTDLDTPGPAAYNSTAPGTVSGKRITGGAFSKAPRGRSSGATNTPGPADYQSESARMSARLHLSAGVGNGSPMKNVLFGSEKRFASNRYSTPAPGEYDPQNSYTHVRPRSASHVFGRAPRSPNSHADRTPGPAAYRSEDVDALGHRTITSVRPNTASAKFGTSSRMQRLLNETPGPYNPAMNGLSTIRSTPKYSLPKASRGDEINKRATTPGPADYANAGSALDKVRPMSATVAFGRDSRFRKNQSEIDVGPGAYDVKKPGRVIGGAIGKGNRSGSMNIRDDSELMSQTPGPAQYNVHLLRPDSTTEGHRIRNGEFGRSSRFEPSFRASTPGPADYRVDSGLSATSRSPTSHKFGTSSRGENLDPTITQVPLYYPEMSSVLPSSPRATFPVANRIPISASGGLGGSTHTTPGPGAYSTLPTPKGPAFTMGAR